MLRLLRGLHGGDQRTCDFLVQLAHEDADGLIAALEAVRLTAPFAALARDTPVFRAFSDEVQATLLDVGRRQRETNNGYLQLLADYVGALERQGVDVLLLKGLYIAQRFYGSIGQRFMWDADILVRPGGYRSAIRVARELGMPVTGPDVSLWLLRLASLHAIEVRHGSQAIDIHWCLRARPGYRIDYEGIWNRAREMAIEGRTFRVLADEDALLLAVLELASDMERGRIKLRSLWDFYLMLSALDAAIDWRAFLESRRSEGLLPLAVNMLSFGLYYVGGLEVFPALAGAIARHGSLLLIDSEDAAQAILSRPRKHLANRSLYARLQPAPAPAYWLRRALTSPLRNALS